MSIERKSARGQIRDALLDRVLSGVYPPGHRLVELALADEFGTSQAPVREALRELAARGFVEIEPRRGTRVHGVPLCELIESLDIRAVLEEFICASLGQRASAFDWGPTRDSAERGLVAAKASDYPTFASHDAQFHRSILQASGNRVAMFVWEGLNARTRIRLSMGGRAQPGTDDFTRLAAEHLRVVEALEAGDAIEASQRLRAHLEGVARTLRAARDGECADGSGDGPGNGISDGTR